MKKFFLLIFCIILMPKAYCTQNIEDDIISPDGTIAPKRNVIQSFFHKKKKDIKTQLELPEYGYSGVLPNLEAEFEYKKENVVQSKKNYSNEEANGELMLDAPFSDPLFLDTIIKKDKNSNYVNDLIKIKETLEKLRFCILNEKPIQMFNANVNILDLQTKALEKKYQNSTYNGCKSLLAIQRVNYDAKLLGNLKYDAKFYSRYMPIENTQYNSQNVGAEGKKLLGEIEATLFEISNAK